MDFHPPLNTRSTEELLVINSDGVNWVPEARALARMELGRRGVSEDLVKDRQDAFSRLVVADHELRELRVKEGYTLLQLFGIFLIAPLLMLGKVFAGHLFMEVKLGLTALDRENYKGKYYQRVTIFVVWAMLLISCIALN